MRKVILTLLACIVTCCHPIPAFCDTWIHTGMVSKHFSSGDHNERHSLIGIEHDDWYLGYYNNSYDDDSFFLLKNYRKLGYGDNVHLGYRVGLITGYKWAKVSPALIPAVFFDYDPVSFDINILPSVVSLELKWKL